MIKKWIIRGCIVLTLGLYFYQVINVLSNQPQINFYSDWPGHLDKARKLDWPWKSGWDTTFWAGYPTLTYPLGAHLILKFFLQITHSDYGAVYFASIVVLSLQVVGIFLLSKKIAAHKPFLQVIFILACLLVLYYSGGEQLGSFLGTLATGGLPAALGIALLLYYLVSDNPYAKAIFLGLTFLTHTLTALLVLGITGIDLIIAIIQWKFKHGQMTKLTWIPLLGGLIIGFPWLLPLADPAFQGIALNMNSDLFTWITPLSIIVMALMIEANVFGTLFTALVLSTIMAIMPAKISHWIQLIGIHGIHFYRFQIMFYLILVVGVIKTITTLKRDDLKLPVFILLVVAGIAGLSKVQYEKATTVFTPYALPENSEVKRVMDVSGINVTGNYYRIAEHTLAQHASFVDTVGLFYEMSQNGPIFYSLATSLNPDFFANGTFTSFFQDYATDSARLDAKETADLLGISDISYFSPVLQKLYDAPTATIGAIKFTNGPRSGFDQVYWYLAHLIDTKLVTSLNKIPEVNQKVNLGTWWFDQTKHELITRVPSPVLSNINLNKPTVSDVAIKPMEISFNVNSTTPAPVLVKFTYSHYWHNKTKPLKRPIWVTPGYMLVYADGPTELVWQPPLYETLAWGLSLFTLGYAVWKVYKDHNA